MSSGWVAVTNRAGTSPSAFDLQADEVDDVRAEIHGHLQAKGRAVCTWEIGTHATPDDLVERLLELGLVDDDPIPLAVGMVLTEPPAQPPADVEVRRAATRAEHLAAARIAAVAFGGPVPTELPADPEPDPDNVVYVAYVDGEPVARGSASFSEHAVALFGGSTLPEARGSRRLPRAGRRPLAGRSRPRHTGARHAGLADVAADPQAARVPRALRDSDPARLVRFGRAVRVSAKADYAIRAAVELAAAGEGPTKGDRIAQAQEIPVNFLENILVDLRNAGIVASRRGADGGYWLARPAAEISLADVIRAVDGPLANVRGVRSEQLAYTGSAAPLRDVWVAVRASLRGVLERSRSPTSRPASYPRTSGSSPPIPTPGHPISTEGNRGFPPWASLPDAPCRIAGRLPPGEARLRRQSPALTHSVGSPTFAVRRPAWPAGRHSQVPRAAIPEGWVLGGKPVVSLPNLVSRVGLM